MRRLQQFFLHELVTAEYNLVHSALEIMSKCIRSSRRLDLLVIMNNSR